MDYFLGIDPGKEGFMVVINSRGELIEAINIPQIGKEYDKKGILDFLTKYNYRYVTLENPGIIHGASKTSVASLQKCVSLIEGILFSTGISHSLPQPKSWQSIMWSDTKKQYKTNAGKKSVDTKATSLLAASNLFPTVDFKVTKKGSKSVNHNDNFVDGILLAEYGRRLCLSNTK